MNAPAKPPSKAQSSRDKVRRHREKLRAQGLRPVQIWLPDTRTSAFRAKAKRCAKALNAADSRDQGLWDALDDAFDDLLANERTPKKKTHKTETGR